MDEHGVGYSVKGLVKQMKDQGNVWQQGDVKIVLAESYGYCWGVERAVQMAYEARKSYPDSKLHITNEIIHNPSVNQRLKEMDIEIIADDGKGKDFDCVQEGDVVILPAFGASVQEMQVLDKKKAVMVDTTCPWVSKVWNAVDNQARKQHTSVIHGKWAHEETVATASFATKYLIVKDLAEAQFVVDFIGGRKTSEELFDTFHPNAYHKGFDPDQDLQSIGIANQTTMLKGDTEKIGKMLESAMLQKVGPAELKGHFVIMDTICDATQFRQDAVYDMVANQDQPQQALDMMLVVGGFNSSNTSHLQEIGEHKGVPSFWVNGPDCIDVASNSIQHKTSWGELATTEDWLPSGPLTIGVTSGASTPDRSVEDVLDQVFRIKDSSFTGIPPLELSEKELAAAAADRPEEH